MDTKTKVIVTSDIGYAFLQLTEPQMRLLKFLDNEGYLCDDVVVKNLDEMPFEEV